jgi:cytochrome P450
MFFLFLAIAGNSTVRSTITGGALALMDHPAEQARLRADRSLVPTAVEEMLRHVSPVNYFRRTATRDCELAGARIAAGDKVTLWYSAANRDERRFVDPDRFDVGRRPNDHIAFGGHGPHFCIGARLARRQVTIVVEELLDHLFPHVEQAGPVRRPPQVHENEIAALPVRVTR